MRYDNSDERFKEVLSNQALTAAWLDRENPDTWRHRRMYAKLDPFIAADSSWLTVGDGRFGLDGQYIAGKGAARVHCSDLNDTLLRDAFERGSINEYSCQNAEALEFPDDAFDFVLCKESLHHFPRPFHALAECCG